MNFFPIDEKVLVTCSDTHGGCTKGLMAPTHEILEEPDRIITQTGVQKWLWEAWNIGWQKVKDWIGPDKWVFGFIGDAIEGKHHGLKELVSTDVADHCAIFDNAVRPFVEDAAVKLFVRGTGAHNGPTDEYNIARSFGAMRHPITKQWAPDRWTIEMHGFPLVMRHQIPTASREYLRGSQLCIQLGNEQLSAAKRGYPIPRGLIVGHRHIHDYYSDSRQFCNVNGPWWHPTRYSHTNWSSMIPEPTLTIYDWRMKEWGQHPHVETFKFTPEGVGV